MPFDTLPKDFTETTDDVQDDILRTLLEADALLSGPEKWCKEALERDGAYCALGAVLMAQSGDVYTLDSAAGVALCRAVGEITGSTSIADYNNAPERTFSDIKALFARAIAARKAELAEQEG